MEVGLTKLLNLTVERFSADEHEFSEYILRVKCDPSVVIQLLAFKGMACTDAGESIHVTDWNTISPAVIEEVARTLMTSYGGFLTGKIRRQKDGSYLVKSVSVMATVEEDGTVGIPDPLEARKKARRIKKTVLL